MQNTTNFLAADLGASNGRVLLARWDGARFDLDVVHRFPNGPVNVPGRQYWDVLRLWASIKEGMARYVSQYGGDGGQRRCGYLGRRLRPARRKRPIAGQPGPLPRCAHGRRAGDRLQPGLAGRYLCRDRPPVHGAEHALPTLCHAHPGRSAVGHGLSPAAHAGSAALLDDRRAGGRIHHRLNHPDVACRKSDAGRPACWPSSICPPSCCRRLSSRARCSARCCPM